MKLISESATIRLEGQLERQRGRKKAKHTQPVILSHNSTLNHAVKEAYLSMSLKLLPFEEIYHSKWQAVLSCRILSLNHEIIIKVGYKRCRMLDIVYTVTDNKGNTLIEKILQTEPFRMNIMDFNQFTVKIPLPFALQSGETTKTTIKFGSKKSNNCFKGLIKEVALEIQKSVGQTDSSCNIQNTHSFSFPEISHPVQLSEFNLVQFLKLKSDKTHYIPKLRSGPKLLICHDMMGGFSEDVNEHSLVSGHHNYRFHHFGITDIFIYFSHYNFTAPTRSWIEVCHSNNVLCLGTFIIQHPLDYVRKETADYLIYLAREEGFDGYLINIEYKVDNPSQFKDWLRYLIEQMHKQLPNSIIIFYDSIIDTGELKWQSQLNEKNLEYFQMSDYFFTDYHWTMQKLQECWAFAESINRTSDVFIGNDIFGRGTFGGGKFQTHKGVTEARKLGFSIALFAQAFTYEVQGMTSVEMFHLQDDALFFGRNFATINCKDQMWNFVKKGGNGWKKEGDEWVTSFDWCQRQWVCPVDKSIRNQNSSITFTVEIKGTPPKTGDPYQVILEIYAEGNMPVSVKTSSKGGDQFSAATEEWHMININVQLKELAKSADEVQLVRVTEVGKDLQKWGGHYGSRFRNQRLIMSSYVKEMDISTIVSKRPLTILPFHTFFNAGSGRHCYFLGQRSKVSEASRTKGYNSLRDYDLPYQDKTLDPSMNGEEVTANICYEDSWVGGSCLKLKCLSKSETFGVYKLQDLDVECSQGLDVKLKIKQQGENRYTLIINMSDGTQSKSIGLSKIVEGSGWTEIAFGVEPVKDRTKSLILEVSLQNKGQSIYIGEMLISNKLELASNKQEQSKYQVRMRESPLKIRKSKPFIDLSIFCENGLQNSSKVIEDTLVPIEKAKFVLVNGDLKGSLTRGRPISFLEALKVESFVGLSIQIVSLDRLGVFRKQFSGVASINNKEYEWYSV